jgi:hypothetical protein
MVMGIRSLRRSKNQICDHAAKSQGLSLGVMNPSHKAKYQSAGTSRMFDQLDVNPTLGMHMMFVVRRVCWGHPCILFQQ